MTTRIRWQMTKATADSQSWADVISLIPNIGGPQTLDLALSPSGPRWLSTVQYPLDWWIELDRYDTQWRKVGI